jgi:hypothetical protein
MLFRNIGKPLPDNTASHPRRKYSSSLGNLTNRILHRMGQKRPAGFCHLTQSSRRNANGNLQCTNIGIFLRFVSNVFKTASTQ